MVFAEHELLLKRWVFTVTQQQQQKNKSKTIEWIMSGNQCNVIGDIDSSPSFGSLRFPKLQIFVDMLSARFTESSHVGGVLQHGSLK